MGIPIARAVDRLASAMQRTPAPAKMALAGLKGLAGWGCSPFYQHQ